MSESWKGTMRWDPYVLAGGHEFDRFWKTHLESRKRSVLFLLGRGFDPRALKAIKQIYKLGVSPRVWTLAFDNRLEDSPQRRELTKRNQAALEDLVGKGNIAELPVTIGMGQGNGGTSKSTKKAIAKQGTLTAVDDVVIDISAMPRTVALSAITKFIHDLDKGASEDGPDINLHVVAAESVGTDLQATGSLMDEVTYLSGFSGRRGQQTTEHVPRVWFPVLGEGQTERLELIRDRLEPDEICPVVPFPSRDPRRGDQIISEHGDILFEDFRVEPSNILRASEFNPFEAYRQLFQAMDRYRRALTELGGCKAFVSPLSSKLLSVGALLACYDHLLGNISGEKLKVGIPYVETAVYADPDVGVEVESELVSMWIRGEWER